MLVKLIDAYRDLSIQVHPDDDYAMKVEGCRGKTEMWYVLDCEPNASLIYGFSRDVTKDEFKTRIRENTLMEVVNKVRVEKGDVFFIPAGTLHAICKGILIAEIQQNSNITYRVYDYGRVGKDGNPRPLHIDKAIDVTNLRAMEKSVKTEHYMTKNGVCAETTLCAYKGWCVKRKVITNSSTCERDGRGFSHLLCIEGNGSLTWENGNIQIEKGSSVFIPASLGAYSLSGSLEYLETSY